MELGYHLSTEEHDQEARLYTLPDEPPPIIVASSGHERPRSLGMSRMA